MNTDDTGDDRDEYDPELERLIKDKAKTAPLSPRAGAAVEAMQRRTKELEDDESRLPQ